MFIIIVIKITIRIYMQGMKNKEMLINAYDARRNINNVF